MTAKHLRLTQALTQGRIVNGCVNEFVDADRASSTRAYRCGRVRDV
jgi:hypothetical protein